jgi:hypothetical protein
VVFIVSSVLGYETETILDVTLADQCQILAGEGTIRLLARVLIDVLAVVLTAHLADAAAASWVDLCLVVSTGDVLASRLIDVILRPSGAGRNDRSSKAALHRDADILMNVAT